MSMLNIIFGLCLTSLGIIGIVTNWWAVADFVGVVIPLIMIIFGVISILAGLSTVKEKRRWKK